ncbi:M20/M25/M40 family metallo-hydrolase [Streptomyces sp. NPDC047028]|uniref:M20/M25/M40 family metallo-hydrolase n=1 Tax=Streptomyces sp. NPDC047028 TaxID=3155793 RepID=UPI0033C3B34D
MGAEYLGEEPERIVIDGCTHLRWRFGGVPHVLLLGHHDTVRPLGSLGRNPLRAEGGVLRGPGCFDMKAGLVMAFHALAALTTDGGVKRLDGLTLLATGDEEPGSLTSRGLIEREASGCAAVLVLEGAGPGGALKTERKGVSRYLVRVRGRAAHSGLEPERGVNATGGVRAPDPGRRPAGRPRARHHCHRDPAGGGYHRQHRSRRGPFGRGRAGARRRRAVSCGRGDARADGLPGRAAVEVEGGPNRPPLTAALSRALFTRARRLASDLGLGPLTEVAVGGASDGNFTAGAGIPTLDGLGVRRGSAALCGAGRRRPRGGPRRGWSGTGPSRSSGTVP